MCRIFGAFGQGPFEVQQLAAASKLLHCGGPDEQTVIARDGWSIGINRLAIQDLVQGSQPYTLDHNIYAVFNGEIYNHLELKRLVSSLNYTLTNYSDGSIIPALYAEYGDRFVEMLDGMFSIAIIDLRKQPKLLLACDPMGMKSLFYKVEDDQIIFSSEIRGLWPLSTREPEILIEKFDLYCAMQSIVGEESIYKGVKALKPGVVKCWIRDGDTQEHYFCGPPNSYNENLTFNESAQLLRRLLSEEVSSMLSADVPVCLVTSGGLDSSLVSVLAARERPGIKAFNIAYKGTWPADERNYAVELAQKSLIDLEVIESDPDSFIELLPKMVWHLGQPNAAPHALSTFILFKTIHERGFKVAVTGEGADEQFGGYARFAAAISNSTNHWAEPYLDKLSAIPRWLREELYHDEYKHFLKKNPSGYEEVVKEVTGYQGTDRLNHLLSYDLFKRFPYYILRRVDHLSMAHSVEVRLPFCQPKITQFAVQLPEAWKIYHNEVKKIVYKSAEGLLPSSILNRPKQPFTLPIEAMLLPPYPLFDYFAEIALSGSLIKTGMVNKKVVEKIIDDRAKKGEPYTAKALWTLGIFELWSQSNMYDFSISNLPNLVLTK
jgi:asparagine synthase (glutamine-hydrolysing)